MGVFSGISPEVTEFPQWWFLAIRRGYSPRGVPKNKRKLIISYKPAKMRYYNGIEFKERSNGFADGNSNSG